MTETLLPTTCAHQLFSLSLYAEQNAPQKLISHAALFTRMMSDE